MYVHYGIISTCLLWARERFGGENDSRYRSLRPILPPLHKMVYRIDPLTVKSRWSGRREKRVPGILYYERDGSATLRITPANLRQSRPDILNLTVVSCYPDDSLDSKHSYRAERPCSPWVLQLQVRHPTLRIPILTHRSILDRRLRYIPSTFSSQWRQSRFPQGI
jgi:hypothetical protein